MASNGNASAVSNTPSSSSSVSALSPVPSLSKSEDSVESNGNKSFVSSTPSLSSSVSALSLIPSPSKSAMGSVKITSPSSIWFSSNRTSSNRIVFSSPKTEDNSNEPNESIPIEAAALKILTEPNEDTLPRRPLPALPEFTKRDEFPVNGEIKLKPSTVPKFKSFVLSNDKLSTEATCV